MLFFFFFAVAWQQLPKFLLFVDIVMEMIMSHGSDYPDTENLVNLAALMKMILTLHRKQLEKDTLL